LSEKVVSAPMLLFLTRERADRSTTNTSKAIPGHQSIHGQRTQN